LDAAGGISATRFDYDKIAVAYARPVANQIVVATITDYTNVSKQVIASGVSALNVELCAPNIDDDDLFAVWDDGAGNLKWANKTDGWTARDVGHAQNISNSFSLQLHTITYHIPFPINKDVTITVPMVYYRDEFTKYLERVYIDGYDPVGGTFSWAQETILTNDSPGKGPDTSSFANDIYHHIVTHCRGANNDAVLTVRMQEGWTNFVFADLGIGTPPTSFEQGLDDLPRMAFQRDFKTNILTFEFDLSSAFYFDTSKVEYNVIEEPAFGKNNGGAVALKLNHIGRPIAAYYWPTNNTVHCSTRGGKVGGYLWSAETCASGAAWDGTSPSIDLAAFISNTYVFYIDAGSDDLLLSVGDFIPPDKEIFGVVTNLNNGEAVTNATLTASETQDWSWVYATTDDSGNYAFEYIPTGMYTVTCSASNYFDEATNVTLTAGNSPFRLDIGMRPIPEPTIFLILDFGFLIFLIKFININRLK